MNLDYSKVVCPKCKSRSFYTRQTRKIQVCIKCGNEDYFYDFYEEKFKPQTPINPL